MKNLFSLVLFTFLHLFFLQLDAQYCNSEGNSSNDEWIQEIEIGSFSNNTGNDNGYGNYTSQTINLEEGENYNIQLNPGYSGSEYTEHWRIWIDFNQDDDFGDANELVYDSDEGIEGTVNGSINIPNGIDNGNTRMRIAMKWVGTYNDGTSDLDPPSSCSDFDFGEVEDYTVNISGGGSTGGPYCSASGDSSDEWIDIVEIGSFSHNSGNDNGYGDYTNQTIFVEKNNSYDIELTPEYSSGSYDEYWRIWIDLNHDDDFGDANELVFDAGSGQENTVNGNITIPSTATNGNTRLRVAMKWVGTYNDGTEDLDPPTACGDFDYGEVQDYTINIADGEPTGSAPVANFNANTTSGTAPLTVNFNDISSNNPTNWSWNFGGGSPNTSSNQNPSTAYNTPGTYTVTLTASNSFGSDTETKTAYITVNAAGQEPIADFSSDVTSGNVPLTVNFYDNSINDPSSWSWTFQGGTPTSSTLQNPTITYNTPGAYNVTLSVSNNFGGDAETKNDYIIVSSPNSAPIADFMADVTSGPAPLSVNFTDLSANNPTSWNWSMPGATPNSSSAQNPSVSYSSPGTYVVTLTSTNDYGSDEEVKTGYITVYDPNLMPQADFTANTIGGTAPLNVQFNDLSTNNPSAWSWTFSGGSPSQSNEQNPLITYNEPGIYTVTLTVTNSVGQDTEIKTNYISVSEDGAEPIASFTASIFDGNAPLAVTFFDQSTNNPYIWEWEFPGASPGSSGEQNPTVTYNNQGVFNVSLTVTNDFGTDTRTLDGFITVFAPTSTSDPTLLNTFALMPNPTSGPFQLVAHFDQSRQFEYTVYNNIGKLITKATHQAADWQGQIDLSTQPNGMYYVQLRCEDYQITKPIIKTN